MINKRFILAQSKIDALKKNIKRDKKDIIGLKKQKNLHEKAKLIVSSSIYDIQSSFQFNIEKTVNSVINYIWDEDDYKFKIEPKERLNSFEWEPKLFDGENELSIKKDNFDVGGGLISTIGVVFKVLFHLLKEDSRNILFLDEPVPNLGELVPKFGDMIKFLSEKFGTQFIIVTHDEKLGNISTLKYKVQKRNKLSSIEKI